MNDAMRPIGVFDSGLGGLTVMKAVMKMLPNEDIIYFGDTARVPYGTKSPEAIKKFSRQNAEILISRGVKAVVVACNSSSSYALDLLQQECAVPVIGVIDPGVRKALQVTRNNRIGVIATQATVNSHAYAQRMKRERPDAYVIEKACPLFVPLVEEGWFAHSVTEQVAEEYLAAVKKTKVDCLILGCTHYPLLKSVLRKVLGKAIRLIDSADEVARDLKDLLEQKNLLCMQSGKDTRHQFFVSDEPGHFQKLAKRFLGRDIPVVEKLF